MSDLAVERMPVPPGSSVAPKAKTKTKAKTKARTSSDRDRERISPQTPAAIGDPSPPVLLVPVLLVPVLLVEEVAGRTLICRACSTAFRRGVRPGLDLSEARMLLQSSAGRASDGGEGRAIAKG
ncbi:MAG: hypothetical protein ACO38P_09870, partial [Phycisphaerales bacterium]